MLEGFTDDFNEFFPADGSRLVSDPVRMEFLDGGCNFPACVRKQGPLGNKVVEGQEDIPDVKDNGIDLGHGKEEVRG